MIEWINPLISAFAALAGAGVGAWGTLHAGKKERAAAASALEADREIERRVEIRQEFAVYATAAMTYLTAQSLPVPDSRDHANVRARTMEVQNARMEVVLSAERLGMMLTRQERPILRTLKHVAAADKSRETAALLEAAMRCIPAWYRGELDVVAVEPEFARKVTEFGGPTLPIRSWASGNDTPSTGGPTH